ncbi:MAG: oligosaccharide flippase family protein [Planctomycetes bacterium]|nr:oligosaccharide flippase family protein [Planctomycetota bacterium]
MTTEAKRGFIRICANYTRLISTIVLGLLVVPLLLEAVGDEGWSLIALLGSTIGLASMMQELVLSSLIRELGAAHHSDDPNDFRRIYNTSMAITSGLAIIASVLFLIILLCLPLFDIPENLMVAAQWLVITRGVETFFILLLAAPFNMYKVSERMVAYNAWLIIRRLCYVFAACWVLLGQQSTDPGTRVSQYAIISTLIYLTALFTSVGILLFFDKRLIPKPKYINAKSFKSILQIGGWNGAATAATTSYRRLAEILMNLSFGLAGNLILGLAIQLTDSVRRLTMGMTDGLDAVSARFSVTKDKSAIKSLLHHSTRLHAFVTFPLSAGILVLAEPALRLWLGKQLSDPERDIPIAVLLIQIMTIGMAARAISDCWLRILYGSGHVKRYAKIIIAGGFIFPLLFFLFKYILPTDQKITAVCWAFSAVLLIIHGGLVPLFSAKAVGLRYHQFYTPLILPLIFAALCSPILFIARGRQESYEIVWIIACVGTYALIYTGLCIAFVMDRAERDRFSKAVIRRLPFQKPLNN